MLKLIDEILGELYRSMEQNPFPYFCVMFVLALWFIVPGAHAATVAPTTMYTITGVTPNSSPSGVCTQLVADTLAPYGALACHTGTVVSVTPTLCTINVNISGSPCAGVGTTSSQTISSSASGCPAGFVLRAAGVCSDVNAAPGTGGACTAGKKQGMDLPDTGQSLASLPKTVVFDGCVFNVNAGIRVVRDGVKVFVLATESTGTTGGATTGTASTVPIDTATCSGSQITNSTSGVVTCLPGTETAPSGAVTNGVDASGNPTTTTKECVGSACKTEKTTTVGGTPTTTTTNDTNDRGRAGACGGIGQPQCSVKVDEAGTTDGSSPLAKADGVISTLAGQKALADAAKASGDLSAFGVPVYVAPSSAPDAPAFGLAGSDSCTEPTYTLHGKTMSLGVCPVAAVAKPILAWLLACFAAFYCWRCYVGGGKGA